MVTDSGRIPKKVPYPRLCRHSLCKKSADKNLVKLGNNLVQTLQDIVDQMCGELGCKAPAIGLQDLIFCFEVTRVGRRRLILFARLAFANCKSGPKPSFQGFIKFEPQSGILLDCPSGVPFRFGDVSLYPAFREFVKTVRPSAAAGNFLDSHSAGAVHSLTNEELVDVIIAPLASCNPVDLVSVEINISLVRHCATPSFEKPLARKCIGLDKSWTVRYTPLPNVQAAAVAPATAAAIDDDDFSSLPSGASKAFVLPTCEPPPAILDALSDGDEIWNESEHSDSSGEPESEDSGATPVAGSDSDSDFDDCVVDELCPHPPPTLATTPPAAAPKIESLFDKENASHGFKEYGGMIHLVDAAGIIGDLVGQIQFLTGRSLSFKAICLHREHQACPGSASASASAPRQQEPCYVLLSANVRVLETYRCCLQFLRRGLELSHLDHKDVAEEMRRDHRTKPAHK